MNRIGVPLFFETLHERDEDLAKPLSAQISFFCPALVQGCNPKKDKKMGGQVLSCACKKQVNLPTDPWKPHIIDIDLPLWQHKQGGNGSPISRYGLQQHHQDE